MNDIATGPENWFYVREGRRQGPFSRSLLVRELLLLDSPEAALVWRTGLPAWTKAGVLDDLRRELPPPVPGGLPLPLVEPELPVPDLPGEEADGDSDPESVGEGGTPADAATAGGRRRRRHRTGRTSKQPRLPSYVLPLSLLFIAVMLALWFLLRRVNEVPPGRIILQGELNGSRSAATPG